MHIHRHRIQHHWYRGFIRSRQPAIFTGYFLHLLQLSLFILMWRRILNVVWLVQRRWSDLILVKRLIASLTYKLEPGIVMVSSTMRHRLGYSFFLETRRSFPHIGGMVIENCFRHVAPVGDPFINNVQLGSSSWQHPTCVCWIWGQIISISSRLYEFPV